VRLFPLLSTFINFVVNAQFLKRTHTRPSGCVANWEGPAGSVRVREVLTHTCVTTQYEASYEYGSYVLVYTISI
jgi:hypothetical protein